MSEQNTYTRKYVFALAFIRGLIIHGVLRANIKIPKALKISLILLLLILISFILTNLGGQKTDSENFFLGSRNLFEQVTLQEDPVDDIIKVAPLDFNGQLAIFIKNLKTGKTYEISADQKYTSASLYKLAVMWATFEAIEKGTLKKESILSANKIVLDKTLEGAKNEERKPSTGNDQEIISYNVQEALRLMITISDNYSAILLSEKLGWRNIDDLMEKEGLGDFDLVSSNLQTSARSVGALFERIYANSAVNSQASQEMKTLLYNQQINDRIPKYLPPDIKVGHKTGELDSIRHDAGIVLGKKSHYIFVFLTDTAQPLDAAEEIAVLSKQIFDALEQ